MQFPIQRIDFGPGRIRNVKRCKFSKSDCVTNEMCGKSVRRHSKAPASLSGMVYDANGRSCTRSTGTLNDGDYISLHQ